MIRKYRDLLLPLLIVVASFASVIVWLRLDNNLPHWDMGRHLYNSILYRDIWHGIFAGQKNVLDLLGFYVYYPPLLYHISLIFNSIFGFTPDASVYSNLVWIIILTFSVYGLAKRLWRSKVSGLIAVVFIMSSPIVIGQIREFQLDFPLTAVFALILYIIVETENFTDRRFSIIAGFVAGLGMLLKWTFLGYALPVAGLFLIIGLAENKKKRKDIIVNFLIAFVIAFILCGYWYMHNWELIKDDFYSFGIKSGQIEGDPTGFTVAAYTWYLDKITIYYLYFPLLLALMVSIGNIIFRKKILFAKVWPYLLLGVIYYLLFSTLSNKDIRYLMPLIVIFAIAASSLVATVKNNIYIASVVTIFVLIYIMNNLAIPFSKNLDIKRYGLFETSKIQPYGMVVSDVGGYTSNSPTLNICPLTKAIDQIPEGSKARLMGEDKMFLNDWDVAYFLTRDQKVWTGGGSTLSPDYIVYKDGPTGSYNAFKIQNSMEQITVYPCTDGYDLTLNKLNK